MGGAIFFSFIFIRGIFPSSAGKPREESLILRSLSRSLGFLVYFCMFVLVFSFQSRIFHPYIDVIQFAERSHGLQEIRLRFDRSKNTGFTL